MAWNSFNWHWIRISTTTWNARLTKPYSKCFPFSDQQQSLSPHQQQIARYNNSSNKRNSNINHRSNISSISIIITLNCFNPQQQLFHPPHIRHRAVLTKVTLLHRMWIFFPRPSPRPIESKPKCKLFSLSLSLCTPKKTTFCIEEISWSLFLFFVCCYFFLVCFLDVVSKSLSDLVWRMMVIVIRRTKQTLRYVFSFPQAIRNRNKRFTRLITSANSRHSAL